jgi:hypothetical protein
MDQNPLGMVARKIGAWPHILTYTTAQERRREKSCRCSKDGESQAPATGIVR